ncbi:MAG: HypC/HybG/HupF family hydrogenase formation chaperone [Blastocatellia bacterium]
MCLAIPGKIVEFIDLENSIAKVEIGGVKRNINTALLDPTEIKIGDYVLIHVGFAMNKIDEQQAQETLRLLQELGEYKIEE